MLHMQWSKCLVSEGISRTCCAPSSTAHAPFTESKVVPVCVSMTSLTAKTHLGRTKPLRFICPALTFGEYTWIHLTCIAAQFYKLTSWQKCTLSSFLNKSQEIVRRLPHFLCRARTFQPGWITGFHIQGLAGWLTQSYCTNPNTQHTHS